MNPRTTARRWVPLVAAAAVVSLVAGGAYAVNVVRPDGEFTPSDRSTEPKPKASKAPPTKAKAKSKKETHRRSHEKPPFREITGAERTEFYKNCVQARKNEGGKDYSDFRPRWAFEFENPDILELTTTRYIIATRGAGIRQTDVVVCEGDGSKEWSGNPIDIPGIHGGFRPVGGPDAYSRYLLAKVGDLGYGWGGVIAPVATVTLEVKGSNEERDALMWHGLWFYPEDRAYSDGDGSYINLSSKVRYRGYDAAGKLVFDSERDPGRPQCYNNPAGTKVWVHNDLPNASVENCRPSYEWRAMK